MYTDEHCIYMYMYMYVHMNMYMQVIHVYFVHVYNTEIVIPLKELLLTWKEGVRL